MKDNKYVILKAISSQFEYYLMEAPSSTYGWMMKLVRARKKMEQQLSFIEHLYVQDTLHVMC